MAFNKEQFIEDMKNMSVLELNELVKAIEEEFGVSAAAPVAVAGGDSDGGGAEASTKTVKLTSAGGSKLKVIQELRKINPELGLPDAKALADNGGDVKADIPAEEAAELVERLAALGAEVEAV